MDPLSKKRRNFYLVFLTIFCILSIPVLVAYSLGYRLGDAWSLIGTGGIYIDPRISTVDVSVDGKFLDTTGILQRNVFTQDLQPGKHKVDVKKLGYRPWYKEVLVQKKKVIELHPLLIKEKIEKVEIEKFEVKKVGTSTVATNVLSSDYQEMIKLFAPPIIATSTKNTKTIETSIIKKSTSTVEKANLIVEHKLELWLEKGNIKYEWKGSRDRTPYYLCSLEDCVATSTLDFKEEIKNFYLYPGREDAVLVLTATGIFSIEMDERFNQTWENIYTGKVADFKIKNGSVFIKEGENFFELKID